MPEQPDPTQGRRTLNETEADRVHDARRTLKQARAADLGTLRAADLRLATKRLCSHLDDMLNLVELSGVHDARTDFARRDLAGARAVLLAPVDAAGLILVIERLRTRLDDILALVDEITSPPPA
jgi:hypothetical protein